MTTKKKNDTSKQLERLHELLVAALIQRIEDGSASASELAVAAKLLKDHGIVRLIEPGDPDHEKLRSAINSINSAEIEEEFEAALANFVN